MRGVWKHIELPVAALLFYALPGCKLERKVTEKGGIESALRRTEQPRSGWESLLSAGQDPKESALSDEEAASLRRVDAKGVVTLISTSPAHVMYHLSRTLREKEYDLLLDQVLSDATTQEYRKRAMDPMEAVRFLAAREKDIQALFAAMPLGDQTPGSRFESIGPNRFRISPPPSIAQELKLKSLEVIIEDRRFRLLMIR